jgi:hypothetical protein
VSQSFHRPEGLERRQLERLEEYVQRGHLMAPEHLLQTAYAHLEDIQGLSTRPGDAELEMARAICQLLDRIVSEWEAFSPVEQSWLRGVMWYFAKSNDECHDHQLGGFRDDAEVLNACLRYVRRDTWMLPLGDNPS